MSEVVTVIYDATVDDHQGHRVKQEFWHRLPERLVGSPPSQEAETFVRRWISEHTAELLRKLPLRASASTRQLD